MEIMHTAIKIISEQNYFNAYLVLIIKEAALLRKGSLSLGMISLGHIISMSFVVPFYKKVSH